MVPLRRHAISTFQPLVDDERALSRSEKKARFVSPPFFPTIISPLFSFCSRGVWYIFFAPLNGELSALYLSTLFLFLRHAPMYVVSSFSIQHLEPIAFLRSDGLRTTRMTKKKKRKKLDRDHKDPRIDRDGERRSASRFWPLFLVEAEFFLVPTPSSGDVV